jgi:hypothetical protein
MTPRPLSRLVHLVALLGLGLAATLPARAAECSPEDRFCAPMILLQQNLEEVFKINDTVGACAWTVDQPQARCTGPRPRPLLPKADRERLEHAIAVVNWYYGLRSGREGYVIEKP